jgi:D-erythronate 2-dehydrogenase
VRVLVVGSEGFIGRMLVQRLLDGAAVGGGNHREASPLSRLTLLDARMGEHAPDRRLRLVAGDISEHAVVGRALEGGIDCVFHLASVPGSAAEQDFERGLKVNLRATLELFEALRQTAGKPRLVYASTIGVYGALPAQVDEDTAPNPPWSYGAHKLIGEALVNDYGRRGFVDGRALRLPGIVARPPTTGMASAFLSDLIRELSAGRPFVCPVGPEGVSWWMSRPQAVDNLLHASNLSEAQAARQRVYLLPVLRLSMAEVVDGLALAYGESVRRLISYRPDAKRQAALASYPPLRAPRAESAGFRHDGTVANLITRALQS